MVLHFAVWVRLYPTKISFFTSILLVCCRMDVKEKTYNYLLSKEKDEAIFKEMTQIIM